jgi:hypothetical protein
MRKAVYTGNPKAVTGGVRLRARPVRAYRNGGHMQILPP